MTGFGGRAISTLPAAMARTVLLAALVALSVVPLWLEDYVVAQLSFVCIYTIAGLGMLVMTGLSGQVSLGHAAFLAIGAYLAAILQGLGVSLTLSLIIASAVSGAIGGVVGLLFSRFSGPYFAMATMAFAAIVKEAITRWEAVTSGSLGLQLQEIQFLPLPMTSELQFFYLALVVAGCAYLAAVGIWNSASGRAFTAVRDDALAARASGIDPIVYKALAFSLSAGFVGLAGALYAYKTLYISPEAFGFAASLELLVLAVVGGLVSLSGAILGALFVVCVPEAVSMIGSYVPNLLAQRSSLQGLAYGVALLTVMVIDPRGLYGLWTECKQRGMTAITALRRSA